MKDPLTTRIIGLLEHSDLSIQIRAYGSLGKVLDLSQHYEPILKKHLRHYNLIVRCLAYREIVRVGTSRALAAVIEAAADDESLSRLRARHSVMKMAAEIPMDDTVQLALHRVQGRLPYASELVQIKHTQLVPRFGD